MIALGHYRWNELAFLAVALAFVGAAAAVAILLLRLLAVQSEKVV